MNILLVYPEMPDTLYAMKHVLKASGIKSVYPPLGLLTIASLLPEEWNKKLADSNVEELKEDSLKWADYVFLSAMNVQEVSVKEIIEKCNKAGVKIVAGGPLFAHDHERFSTIDHFILNEAEITLPLFIEDLKQGKAKSIYQTNKFADITQSPIPAFELVDSNKYYFSIVQYSRGCPYKCDFCDVTTLYGKRVRTKSSDQIIRELEMIARNSNTRSVLFADDNMIGNKQILKKELLPALIEWRKRKKPSFYFATQLTINLVEDDELMQLMLEAGFRDIFVGIETPDENALEKSGKKQNLKRNQLNDINKLHEKGFIIAGGFIVGFDTDTQSTFQQQTDFIQQSGIIMPIVNMLKAPPGTVFYDRMKKEGRLAKQFSFAEGDTNIIPVMNRKTLNDGFIMLIDNIYAPEKSYDRIIRFFNTYKYPKTTTKVPFKFEFIEIISALRIIYIIGIKDPDRKYFWKLILWTLRNDTKLIEMAFRNGMVMYQMHKTYQHIRSEMEN